MRSSPKQILSRQYDIIIIGAGIVGCAMARQFTLQGASVLTIEKGSDILDGASKGNSAILHTGFDAPPGSLEQACIADSYQEYLRIRHDLKLPLLETSALVSAWSDDEENALDGIMQKARQNGVDNVRLLTTRQVRAMEPALADTVKAAVHVPGESVIDPWTAPFAYMLQALQNGAALLRSTEVTKGVFDGVLWHVTTSSGCVKGAVVINCAGLYGDRIDIRLLGRSQFHIRPRKGQFIVYDKAASRLIKSIILPVPNEITKGVVVCRSIFGNVLVGPTAEEQESRDDASVQHETLLQLRHKAREIIPALEGMPITATFAGIRPATEHKDYCILALPEKHYISVGGIRSTGLTAALGIARHVYANYQQWGAAPRPPNQVLTPALTPIAETQTRDWQQPGNEGIVCHCEQVTQREIRQALAGDMPARSLAGLKRRTRVTMGRCQGFYCSARLSELTQGCFEQPMAVGDEHE